MNNKNGFALIELLGVVALISIFSAVGVVTYNGYISNAKDKKAQSNFNQIVKLSLIHISEPTRPY